MSYVGEYSVGRPVLVFDADGVPRVEGSRCPTCGDVRVPFRQRCVNDLAVCEPFVFSGAGTVYAAVKVSLAPQGFEAPFWAGYVDLDEGVRIFGQVTSAGDGTPPAAGDRVRLIAAPLSERDGEVVTGPMFTQAE